jgi:hypothetical protein
MCKLIFINSDSDLTSSLLFPFVLRLRGASLNYFRGGADGVCHVTYASEVELVACYRDMAIGRCVKYSNPRV